MAFSLTRPGFSLRPFFRLETYERVTAPPVALSKSWPPHSEPSGLRWSVRNLWNDFEACPCGSPATLLDNRDAGRVEVYVGRLAGTRTPDDDVWKRHIRLAERLPIHAHAPPTNVQKSLAALATELRDVHVLNWAYHQDLLPEVSGPRWASLDEDFPDDHAEFTVGYR